MNNRTGYWDHKTKPSNFVVLENKKEIFRGPFTEGYKLLNEKKETYREAVLKYFTEPACLLPKNDV
jgi:hypothetical protein